MGTRGGIKGVLRVQLFKQQVRVDIALRLRLRFLATRRVRALHLTLHGLRRILILRLRRGLLCEASSRLAAGRSVAVGVEVARHRHRRRLQLLGEASSRLAAGRSVAVLLELARNRHRLRLQLQLRLLNHREAHLLPLFQ